MLRSFGTPESALHPLLRWMILLEEQRDGEPRKRIYRAVYGKDVSLSR